MEFKFVIALFHSWLNLHIDAFIALNDCSPDFSPLSDFQSPPVVKKSPPKKPNFSFKVKVHIKEEEAKKVYEDDGSNGADTEENTAST